MKNGNEKKKSKRCDCGKLAKDGNFCHSCKKTKYKEKYPIRYAYQVLRNNARRRGIQFDLTLAQFKRFCQKTNIMVKRGIFKESYHIDRIDEEKGYSIDNIQPLTNSQNVKKYITYCEHKRGLTTRPVLNSEDDFTDVPF